MARAYAGHTEGGGEAGGASAYVRASLSEVAAALGMLDAHLSADRPSDVTDPQDRQCLLGPQCRAEAAHDRSPIPRG